MSCRTIFTTLVRNSGIKQHLSHNFSIMADTSVLIDFSELSSSLKSLTVVDVRTRDELKDTGKLPGSYCVPLPEVAEAFSDQVSAEAFQSRFGFPKPSPDVGGKLVITCRSGRRVMAALAELEKLGYKGLRNYKGSYLDWVANNGPLEKFE